MNDSGSVGRSRSAELAPLEQRLSNKLRPPTHGQERLWFLDQFEGGVATYAVPLVFRIVGPLCLDNLNRALSKIVQRHEALRTGLIFSEGSLWQQISSPIPITVLLREARDYDDALQQAREELVTPFDLGKPPLFRACAFRLAPQDCILTLVFHHIICDAWTLDIFLSELGMFWASRDGTKPVLPDVDLQYADFAQWQQEWLRGHQAEIQRNFWREHLTGASPRLQLGQSADTLGPRSYSGSVERFCWEANIARAVQLLAARNQTTPFIVLLAAFQALLYRYSLQDNITVGVPVACRTQLHSDALIGFLANTLPLRADYFEEQSFLSLLEQTNGRFLAALDAQDIPFDQIVDAISLPREAEQNPLFQAIFVMQSTPKNAGLHLAGLSVERIALHSGTAKVDLTCSVDWSPGIIDGEIEYSTERFDNVWAKQFINSFYCLLADALQRPHVPIAELSLLTADEITKLVNSINTKFETYCPKKTVTDLFESQVERTPNAIAIETRGSTLTYTELNTRANHLARVLIERGAGPEKVVGLAMRRSVDVLVALLGVLKSGAAFIPLDLDSPLDRLGQICCDAEPLCLLIKGHDRNQLSKLSIPLIFVDEMLQRPPVPNLGLKISPTSLAYVYYTSGSTGAPKGVMIEHHCAMTRLQWLRSRYPLSEGDAVLHKSPLIFDVAIWEIVLPLINGAAVVLADVGAEADPAHLSELLRTRQISLVHFVPSMLQAYLAHTGPSLYRALRWVCLSGEAVPADLPQRFLKHCDAELHNQYGQTETSEVAIWECGQCPPTKLVPLGRQVGAYRLFATNSALELVPPGVPGELCVAGLGGLARGYHRRPDLTAEKFVPNPYALQPGERLYRTGDLVRMQRDGNYEYLGRIDQQIKIRGCRVEIGEVESVLAQHASVEACAVVARPDGSGSNQLVAYVISNSFSAESLATHVGQFLPAYMHPAVYVLTNVIPRTASGKIDRSRLIPPQPSDFLARGSAEEARTPLECELTHLWAQLLGIDHVGRTDNFFAIGGNSLKAVHVVSKITETFGISVSVRDFFAGPTVAELAQTVQCAIEKHVASLTDRDVAALLEEVKE